MKKCGRNCKRRRKKNNLLAESNFLRMSKHPHALSLYRAPQPLKGVVDLSGSKSISNRVLIIRALCKYAFAVHKLAAADDTRLLQELLESDAPVRDAGPAGTTFRFLTAFLSLQEGEQVLTGSERMKNRPIGLLVDALRSLGANISYLEKEGYPPLKIGAPGSDFGRTAHVRIPANTSSQYISALLMIAPVLPQGLVLELEGKIVSRPYIEMTLALMAYFGVQHEWTDHTITIAPQEYQAKDFTVEADWSAASYYYTMAAFAPEVHLQLNGLFASSTQGDAVLVEMMEAFGVQSDFNTAGVLLTKSGSALPGHFQQDFLRCPDLAQSLAVVCGGLGVPATFTGLETLGIKETDRILALKTELGKLGVEVLPQGIDRFELQGRTVWKEEPEFQTYEDHRMAMAFAPLAMQHRIRISEPAVVGKSYPAFWEDIQQIGFDITHQY